MTPVIVTIPVTVWLLGRYIKARDADVTRKFSDHND
jgi:hypothetical protein